MFCLTLNVFWCRESHFGFLQRFVEFLCSKTGSAAVFSDPLVPAKAASGSFDVFDATFHRQSDDLTDASATVDSSAYNAFLRCDSYSGEMPSLKSDWLRRMRRDVYLYEQRFANMCAAVKKHEDSGGDPKDTTYLKNKYYADEFQKERAKMAIDTEEGNVSSMQKGNWDFL
jgi:hypothetical protein